MAAGGGALEGLLRTAYSSVAGGLMLDGVGGLGAASEERLGEETWEEIGRCGGEGRSNDPCGRVGGEG